MQGVSRSAAIVIAYLIRKRGMSFDSAVTFVRQRRPCIKPNSGFVRCLREWERQWCPRPACSPAVTRVPIFNHLFHSQIYDLDPRTLLSGSQAYPTNVEFLLTVEINKAFVSVALFVY
jgi:Dual specificity phosphatase, catalytic domain